MNPPSQAKTFRQFLNEVEDLKIVMRWRDGQALFNHLYAQRKDLAEQLRATDLDPFFVKKDHPKYKAALKWLEENWSKDAIP